MNWDAVWLTARLALVVTVLLLAIGMPLAYLLAFRQFRFKWLVEATIAMPLVLPPTVLGFYLLVSMGPNSAPGRWYAAVTGNTLAFSFEGLVVASLFYSLPFAVQPMASAFAGVDRQLLAASALLGASRRRTFLRIVLPLAAPGVVSAAVLTFAHTVGEFGVVLMVGGNIPGITQTLSIDIYDSVQALDYARAHRTSAFLLAFSLAVLSLVYGFDRRARVLVLRGDAAP